MFAVIRTGGKQYKVAKDDIIIVEKLLGKPGEKVRLGDVLMLGEEGKAPTVGTPLVEKAAVTAEVIEQGKGDKVIVFKKKRSNKIQFVDNLFYNSLFHHSELIAKIELVNGIHSHTTKIITIFRQF